MTTIRLEKIEIPPLGIHLTLGVRVNGVSTNMVLDTGASRSVIDLDYLSEIIPELSLNEEEMSSASVGAGDLQSFTTILDLIEIEEFRISQFEIAVMDLTHVKSSYLQLGEEAVFGVIGGDILSEYDALIDYSALTLKLRPNN
ncbi:MAG: clan AA aspartic protease [Flavobacteriales bacterium]|nr:clan AA aspartic protease [Flavobacteriales bacterium]